MFSGAQKEFTYKQVVNFIGLITRFMQTAALISAKTWWFTGAGTVVKAHAVEFKMISFLL